MTRTISAIGALMRNTPRHEACWASQPPSTGPPAAVIAANPDHVPIARPRSTPVNVALMSASDSGIAHAAPIPWMQRAAISTSMLGAKAQASEAAVKITIPMTKSRLRP